jgi:CubicO group peptidase (beta-lactamase class C family)
MRLVYVALFLPIFTLGAAPPAPALAVHSPLEASPYAWVLGCRAKAASDVYVPARVKRLDLMAAADWSSSPCRLDLLRCLPIATSLLTKSTNPMDALFTAYTGDSPGAALAIIQDGELRYQKGYGLADLEANSPVTACTNFRLASISKQFTASAILLLEQAGKLDLDWPLSLAFEGFPEYGQNIRIHHLLNHTSGIPDYEPMVPAATKPHELRDAGVLEIILKTDSVYFPAGTQFRYSNTAYALLALMVEKYSGQTYPDFLQEHIFEPLGMTATVAYVQGQHEVPARAFGYGKHQGGWVQKDQSNTSAVLGDGGIYSNLLDLFRWDQALHTGKILPLPDIEKTFAPSVLLHGDTIPYGYGWQLKTSPAGEQVVYHTGSTTSFRNVFYRIPSRKLSIIILTNRNTPREMDMVGMAEKVLKVWESKSATPP